MPSPLEAAFESFLHTLNAAEEPTFGALLDVVHRTKFSGSLVIHCYQGEMQILELGRPLRIDLTRRRKPALDNPTSSGARSLTRS